MDSFARRLVRPLLLFAVFAAGLPAAAIADPAHPELSDRLDDLDSAQLNGATPAEQAAAVHLPARGAGSLQRIGDRIVVEIRFAHGAAGARDELEAAGARVLDVSEEYQRVTAAVDPDDFKAVSDVPGVRGVVEALAPMVGGQVEPSTDNGDGQIAGACPNGAATSEGDQKLNAAAMRSALGVDGSSQKVGVISDSFDNQAAASTHAAQDVATGDLPGPGNPCGRNTPVDVVDEGPPTGGDEGRAMLQIVHDVAPGAKLAFADSATTQFEFADQIRKLRDAGATVISDDITFFGEPVFQKGPIDAAVDEVNAAGIPFFSDAANNNVVNGGQNVASWEAPAFRQSAACPATTPVNYTCMDFDPGAGDDPTIGINLPGGSATTRVSLQWAEPWNGVGTDLDILVYNNANTFLFATNTRNVGVSQTPFDFTGIVNSGATGTAQIAIGRFTGSNGGSGTNTPRAKLTLLQNGNQTGRFTDHLSDGQGDVVGPTIFGHNGSENGSGVAAVDQADPGLDQPEVYSSRGPVTHYFGPADGVTAAAPLASPQVLSKPDITATDCTSNTFFGGGNKFCGTSAASPHAAAIAALMLDANPTLTPAQVRSLQAANASPVGAFGPLEVGAGLVNATAAAPGPRVQASAPALTNAPSVAFSANRSATFTCRVDGGTPQACSSPFSPTGLGDGPHSVTVTGTDPLAHTGSAIASFTLDTTPPAVNVASGPGGPTNDAQPTFGFGGEAGSSFVCRFDGATEGPCSAADSHRPGAPLPDGGHNFEVTAVDAAGNRASASRAFTVDTAAPGANIDSGPNGLTRDNRPTFGFSSGEAGAGFVCSVDGAPAGPCTGPGTFRPASALGDGPHTFQVVAADTAGNTSPAARSFTVDATKPTAKVKKGPKKKTTSHKAKFTFTASETGSTFSCKLDRGKAKACKSKATFKVKKGRHTLQVTATDAAGNASKPVKFRWRVTR